MAYSSTAAVNNCVLSRSEPRRQLSRNLIGVQTGGRSLVSQRAAHLHPLCSTTLTRPEPPGHDIVADCACVHECTLRSSVSHLRFQLAVLAHASRIVAACCSLSQSLRPPAVEVASPSSEACTRIYKRPGSCQPTVHCLPRFLGSPPSTDPTRSPALLFIRPSFVLNACSVFFVFRAALNSLADQHCRTSELVYMSPELRFNVLPV